MSRQHSIFQGPKSTLSTLSSTLRDGIGSLLGVEKVRHCDATVARIRSVMVRMHGERGRLHNPRLHFKLRSATDAEGLWYARVDLYADLCRWYDEQHAIRCLQDLHPLFKGVIPASLLKSRTPTGLPGIFPDKPSRRIRR